MESESLPKATFTETLQVVAEVLVPNISKGVIIRRPSMVKLAQYFELDMRAVRRFQKLQEKYTYGPLLLRIPFRKQAVILAPEHVHDVFDASPEPFATASGLKKSALAHFQPKVSLISHGRKRRVRRNLQEEVLDMHQHVHRYAAQFIPIIQEETQLLLDQLKGRELTWDDFVVAWYKIVRRIVFGDAARDDHGLTDMLGQLRKDANWAFAKPQRKKLRKEFLTHLENRLNQAESGSLAYIMRHAHKKDNAAPVQQIPQWLFAYEPAGIAIFRTLAIFATHQEPVKKARQEAQQDTSSRTKLPYTRACVLETLRLWPTTPLVLRETTRTVEWSTGLMSPGTSVLIFAPFFHRDDRHIPNAHRFLPEHWRGKDVPPQWPLIPFSEGPVECPGKQLVLLTTSAMLATMIDRYSVNLTSSLQPLKSKSPLPGTLDHFSLRFKIKEL